MRSDNGRHSGTERSMLRDATWVLWIAAYVLLIWRWNDDRGESILFPIVWGLYTVLGLVAVVLALRDRTALAVNAKGRPIEARTCFGTRGPRLPHKV
jgi:hypothetical protein